MPTSVTVKYFKRTIGGGSRGRLSTLAYLDQPSVNIDSLKMEIKPTFVLDPPFEFPATRYGLFSQKISLTGK